MFLSLVSTTVPVQLSVPVQVVPVPQTIRVYTSITCICFVVTMSLSFVTKAIQTTAADGTFEEQAVENDDDNQREATRGRNTMGLFDQLRQNKDEEEAARLEFQRSIMRGTLALDEDDAAHLQELQRQKEAQNDAHVRYTEMQLASFRAAQAERFARSASQEKSQQLSTHDSGTTTTDLANKVKLPIAPNIQIRKRRRQEHSSGSVDVAEPLEQDLNKIATLTELPVIHDEKTSAQPLNHVENSNSNRSSRDGAVSSLLVGYSSDEDD